MGTLSAADILKSDAFFESAEKTRRYIHHKFQDYGYRMAEQLGDLQHKAIYMSLAKNEDRFILDRALHFTLDYRDVPNKGKLFMWKLAQLRAERDLKAAKTNFEHDFVMETMSKTYDSLAGSIYAKHKSQMNDAREARLNAFATRTREVEVSGRAKHKLLDLGVSSGVDAHILSRHLLKLFGFDISRQLVNIAKQHCKDATVVRKRHFLEHSYKKAQFQGVWMDKFWQVIPYDSEPEYLSHIYDILDNRGVLGLTVKPSTEREQHWQEIQWQDKTLLTLFKTNPITGLVEQAEKIGFELIENIEIATQNQLLLQKA